MIQTVTWDARVRCERASIMDFRLDSRNRDGEDPASVSL
jgi:hypothetical protein